eukprot:CAMPEP_0113938266 /NCGR_PEP_ID=MMETSP1339-20121228/4682_1 /TAXON_ID=94617 /ORGANISM="Fibrocapsa japonica" /LENGTH=84 /DNA_ID=CAMNT_0000941295 /DNA_START=93 /DNA_END=347 /DNA_ORIENTATION=+ /assembly_acc=CAM_ASM_000762
MPGLSPLRTDDLPAHLVPVAEYCMEHYHFHSCDYRTLEGDQLEVMKRWAMQEYVRENTATYPNPSFHLVFPDIYPDRKNRYQVL